MSQSTISNFKRKVPIFFLIGGVILLALGTYRGLFVAPREEYMGETQRIMYIHVPTAWTAMLVLTFGFVSAVAYLFKGKWKWDSRLEAAVELGVLYCFLLCAQGSIWAKPTWGVWWDWDPRLTTTAVLLFAFLGILALRTFVDEPVKRATWSAVATVIAYVDVPIVYFSVKWWNSLHQQPSTPGTVSPDFWIPIQLNALGVIAISIAFLTFRTRIAAAKLKKELAPAITVPLASHVPVLAGGAR